MATKQAKRWPDIDFAETAHATVQDVYDAVLRERLPRRLGVFNGIPARGDRLLDSTDTHPDYEAAIVKSLREFVDDGDDVVVVGGGIGVSSVVAANRAGKRGHVTTYEASGEHVQIVEETARLNDVADHVITKHSIVGEARSTRGSREGAIVIPPEGLPECDVLELDCEGAETTILRALQIRPRVLVVETHGFLGAPTHEVRDCVTELGYEIVREEPEVEEKDVMVLTAVRQ